MVKIKTKDTLQTNKSRMARNRNNTKDNKKPKNKSFILRRNIKKDNPNEPPNKKKKPPRKPIQKKPTNKKQGIKVDERARSIDKRYRFLTFKMYIYKIFNYLLKGNIDVRDPNLNGDNIQIGYAEIFTQKTVTRYYYINHLPEETPVALANYLIRKIKTGKFWVNISLQTKSRPYKIDFDARYIQSKRNMWGRILNGNLTDEEDAQYQDDVARSNFFKKTARMYRSYFKIRDNKNHIKETSIILKLQTKEKSHIKVTEKNLKSVLDDLEIDFTPVRGTLLDFLRAFSPISKRKTVSEDTTQRLVMTNRDIADLIPYRQGRIGDGGLWFGIDKYSGSSIWLDIMNNPDAKNILVMGLTGSGKTFYVSMLLFFHNAREHNIFTHDHKGNEFVNFTRAVNGLVISMTPSKTSYINTFKIPYEDVETEEELRGLFTESYSMSELIFLTLTEPDPHELKPYKNMFNDFMQFVYGTVGVVTNEVETYPNSSKLTPMYLYTLFEQFSSKESGGIVETYGTRMLSDVKQVLYKYWHPRGTRNELFLNEIDMEQIKQNRVVCFDFGMAEVTRNSVPPNELKLKRIYMNIAASRFANEKYKKKEVIVNVIEEIQSADEDELKFTAANVTEGRAKGMINYVLGNSAGSLKSGGESATKIIDNMNIQVLGKLYKDAREFYLEKYDLQEMREDLEKIARGGDFKHCFLLNCAIVEPVATAVAEMVTTSRIAESKYFKTVYAEDKVN